MNNRKTVIERFDSPEGQIAVVTMTNRRGASVSLSNLGAGIVSVIVPDREGKLADVAIGYENPTDYMADGPCAGKVPGRYANRIANGLFTLDGVAYKLAINNGPNALHGGPTGFQNRLWDVGLVGDDSVRFTRLSPDGEEGYPGNLTVVALYRWTDDNRLELTLEAQTDVATIVNLTNHAYFNLSGHDSGSVLDHELRLAA
ncbi:MAG: galactose mutarotase, partial [Muribaculaceae bacterium]|nr:galactose mutarotase [Muribaculaceae bacterium]